MLFRQGIKPDFLFYGKIYILFVANNAINTDYTTVSSGFACSYACDHHECE